MAWYDNYDYGSLDTGGYDYDYTSFGLEDYDYGAMDLGFEDISYDFDYGIEYDAFDFDSYGTEWSFNLDSGDDYGWLNDVNTYWDDSNMFNELSIGNAFTDFDYGTLVTEATVGALQTGLEQGFVEIGDAYGPIGGLVAYDYDKAEFPSFKEEYEPTEGELEAPLEPSSKVRPVIERPTIGEEDIAKQVKMAKALRDALKDPKAETKQLLAGLLTGAVSGLAAQKQSKAVEKAAKTSAEASKYATEYSTDTQKEIALKELTKNIEEYNLERTYALEKEQAARKGRAELFGVEAPEFEPVKQIETAKYLGDIEELKRGVLG